MKACFDYKQLSGGVSNLYDIPTCLTVHPANEVARVSPAENGALLCFSI